MTTSEQGRFQVGRSVTLGNFISPMLTVLGLGIPALIWGGRVDTRVENLATSVASIRTEITDIKSASNTTAATLVGISYTISEGLKQTIADQGRRIVNLEAARDKQAEEINRLQIEIATIRRASEPTRRP